jgi:putative tryptophan/tyrosine transport system substrate-binding protein
VDILVAGNSVAAVAARKATGATPIVIVTPDPVALGLVASWRGPEGT